MTVSLKLLTALNIATTDNELLDTIEAVSQAIENGHVYAESDYDAITSLHLTEAGRAAWPRTLPASS
jgi:hypothetical protein